VGRGGKGRGEEGKGGGEKGRGRSSPNVRDVLTPLTAMKKKNRVDKDDR